MIQMWLAKFGGQLMIGLAQYAGGWLTCKYQWHNAKVKIGLVKEVSRETNKQILHAAENQIVFAETKRDVVRTEYRDRLRDITISEAEQCRSAASDRAPSNGNDRKDETVRAPINRTSKDDLIEIASECYSGVATIREQLKALIQAEESMGKE
jgi:hypothetical protein